MNIQDIFDKHIKEDINIFPYQLQKSFDNFSNSERKLYEIGFKNGLRFLNKSSYTKKYYFRVPKHNLGRIKEEELQQLIQKVCDRYEVSKKELFTKCRRRDIVRSRNILHNVLNEKYKMNLTNIGRIFGQDHTTVLYSIQMKFNKTFYWDKNQTIWEETKELFI
jgi:hypothetical protein